MTITQQTLPKYVILFLRAVGGSFHWPATQASTSLMAIAGPVADALGVQFWFIITERQLTKQLRRL
jgi:hypothetical protein